MDDGILRGQAGGKSLDSPLLQRMPWEDHSDFLVEMVQQGGGPHRVESAAFAGYRIGHDDDEVVGCDSNASRKGSRLAPRTQPKSTAGRTSAPIQRKSAFDQPTADHGAGRRQPRSHASDARFEEPSRTRQPRRDRITQQQPGGGRPKRPGPQTDPRRESDRRPPGRHSGQPLLR